ncbi:hypothetical protein THAOC_20296, partial [Thalassiosira oceanica]
MQSDGNASVLCGRGQDLGRRGVEIGRRGAAKEDASREDAAERRGEGADEVAPGDEAEAEIPDGGRAGRGGGDPPVRGERSVRSAPIGRRRQSREGSAGRTQPAGSHGKP